MLSIYKLAKYNSEDESKIKLYTDVIANLTLSLTYVNQTQNNVNSNKNFYYT